MRYINNNRAKELINMKEAISIMEKTFIDMAENKATQVLRRGLPLYDNNIFGIMPAYLNDQGVFGAKLITVFPNNSLDHKPSHQGYIMLFDDKNGDAKGIIDASYITGIRTAAVSAVATQYLSNKNAKILTLIGCGVQAESHMEAMLAVRPIEKVKVFSLSKPDAERFAKRMTDLYGIEVTAYESVEEATKDADIICTLTPAHNPVLFGYHVKKGAHINAVGACTPNARELDSQLMTMSRLVVDNIESVFHESGDILIPIQEGRLKEEAVLGDLGQVIVGDIKGRLNKEDITVFEALGLAVEDLAIANEIFERDEKKR